MEVFLGKGIGAETHLVRNFPSNDGSLGNIFNFGIKASENKI